MNARRALVGLAAAVTMLLLCACSSSGSGKAAPSTGQAANPSAKPSATTPAAPAAVAARPSPGCTPSKGVKADGPGEQTIPFAAAGDTGLYVRHLPPSYDGRTPLPLVLDLHGYSETAAIQVNVSALGPFGDAHHFVTLTPQTTAPVPLWSTDLKGKDVAFLGALLDTAEQTLCIDQARIFVTGYSNGAFMTSALACAFSSRIAAVAPIAGIQEISGCTFQRPVPVVAFHGTADPFVPYDGSIGPAALKLPAPDGSGKTLGQLGAASKSPARPSRRPPPPGQSAMAAAQLRLTTPSRVTSRSSATRAPLTRPRSCIASPAAGMRGQEAPWTRRFQSSSGR